MTYYLIRVSAFIAIFAISSLMKYHLFKLLLCVELEHVFLQNKCLVVFLHFESCLNYIFKYFENFEDKGYVLIKIYKEVINLIN